MKKNKDTKIAIFSGLLAGIAASSCCIAPAIALIAGIGGTASAFSWIEPIRPYLIGFSIVAIGYTWYNYFKTKKDACGCSTKPKWYQTKAFLIIITIFATLSITFPYYSKIFYLQPKQMTTIDNQEIATIELQIQGMTCSGCEEHIEYALKGIDGIIDAKASYEKGKAIVKFNKNKITANKITNKIDSTGYKVIKEKNI